MLQAWADVIDAWCKGESVKDIVRSAKISAADVALDLI